MIGEIKNGQPANGHPSYPSRDIARTAARARKRPEAVVQMVTPESPADDAGFTPGCRILAVDGQPLRDVIDWRWLSDGDEIELSYIDTDGDAGDVVLEREEGEDWGFTFEGLVFDDVLQCRNACTFCFMHQLPKGLRPSLTLRDDDYRLSFLVGTFVTLTNLSPEDEQRIIEQRITPLHVSLQVSNREVRRKMIGRNADHGIDALDRLLEAGIQVHAQIVLVPDANDGDYLVETLNWAYERPGILDIGIVPLGYTKYQTRFDHSFNDPKASKRVLDDVAPFRERALAERGTPWVFPADEFYSNAYHEDIVDEVPDTASYGEFELFEDGIGIIRSTIDDWNEAVSLGVDVECASALRESNTVLRLVAGEAQRDFLDQLVARSPLSGWFEPFYVKNEYFGGNVNVTGLLVGGDVSQAIAKRVKADREAGETRRVLYAIQEVVFNDDDIMLDDMRLEDMVKAAGVPIAVVSCTPLDYLRQIAELASS